MDYKFFPQQEVHQALNIEKSMHWDIADIQTKSEQQNKNHQAHVNSNAHQTCYIILYPFKCIGKSLENLTTGGTTLGQTFIKIIMLVERKPQQMIVIWWNWNKSESWLNIGLCHVAIWTKVLNDINSILNWSIFNRTKLSGNSMVNWFLIIWIW